MCYDISCKADVLELKDFLPDVEVDPAVKMNFEPKEHIQAQSFEQYPAIIRQDGKLKMVMMEWGVVGDFMKTPEEVEKRRPSMCNTRSERVVGDKKSYWHKIRHQHCLILVTGIFEHREIKGWKNKVPYYIWVKHRRTFALPALFNYGKIPGRGNEMVYTFSLLTRKAVINTAMKQIHNAKPNDPRIVLFQPDKLHEELWLVDNMTDAEMEKYFKYEIPPDKLAYHPVYTIRGGRLRRPDDKDIIEEYNWPGLPPLGEDVQKSMF